MTPSWLAMTEDMSFVKEFELSELLEDFQSFL
jgi:hypothetical protein